MERGSNKHNPRLDEQLEHETRALVQGHGESRSQESRLQEDTGDDEPELRVGHRFGEDFDPDLGVSVATAEARAELARAFVPSLFPATRDVLLGYAEANPVPPSILDRVRELPAGETYDTVQAMWQALGEPVEEHHTRAD